MTTNTDLFRDNLRDLVNAHKFRTTNSLEDDMGNTSEVVEVISESKVEWFVAEVVELLNEIADEEPATENDRSVKITK